jgi:hypothetical protein
MFGEVDAALEDLEAIGFKQALLERGVRFTQKNTAIPTDHAVPRDTSAARSSCHRAPCRARTAAETQDSSQPSIS